MIDLMFKVSYYKEAGVGSTVRKLIETPIMLTTYTARKVPVGILRAFGKYYWTLPIIAAASKIKEKSVFYDAFYPKNKANIITKIIRSPTLREAISSPLSGVSKL